MDRVEKVQAEKTKQYGDATFGTANLGLAWTGILQNHFGVELPHVIPSHVILLMMASIKVNLAAMNSQFQEDDYVDGISYFELAEKARIETQEQGANKDGNESNIVNAHAGSDRHREQDVGEQPST